jgi:hypothetical protein
METVPPTSDGNHLSDFPSGQFRIVVFCDSCDHQADVDRDKVPDGMTIPELRQRLRCAKCGSRECSLRITSAGAGGFR